MIKDYYREPPKRKTCPENSSEFVFIVLNILRPS